MAITAQMVKELRAKTGAGMMDCKKALAAADGDVEKAIEALRKKGLAAAAKKEGRVAAEGLVASYIHGNGRIGVLVEVNSETDFVARNDEFQGFVRDIAMHIAAASPRYVRREEVPEGEVDKERSFLLNQVKDEGKPEHVAEKIVTGRMDKFFKQICLLEQEFVKDPDLTVAEYTTKTVASIGEKIDIRRFERFELGEGIAKREEDYAAEVAKAAQAS